MKLTVSPAKPGDFVVYVRIPGWSAKNVIKVDGVEIHGAKAGEYLAIRRSWSGKQTIDLSFDMTTHLLKANPEVTEDRGRIAFQRGPLVFCMEHLDQKTPVQGTDLAGYRVDLNGRTTSQFHPELLDGVMVLEHPGMISSSSKGAGLYYPASSTEKTTESSTSLRLIPYYAWANRSPASMQVWIPYENT